MIVSCRVGSCMDISRRGPLRVLFCGGYLRSLMGCY